MFANGRMCTCGPGGDSEKANNDDETAAEEGVGCRKSVKANVPHLWLLCSEPNVAQNLLRLNSPNTSRYMVVAQTPAADEYYKLDEAIQGEG